MNVSTSAPPASASPELPPLHTGLGLLRWQKILGWLTTVVLLAGFAVLVDGLVAEMQRGPNRIDALPASVTPLSGPIPVKKAELEDFFVQGNSPDGQVRLELDSFFASYWFGSGMWRGRLVVGDNPGIGEYPFIVEFRDAPPTAAQQYRVVVWQDAEAMREGSFSYVLRETGQEPFRTAAVLLGTGLLAMLLNFLLGRRWQHLLRRQGCGEIYKVLLAGEDGQEATFSMGVRQGMRVGQPCQVLTPGGVLAGEYVVAFCEPNHASLLVPADAEIRPGWIVRPLPMKTSPVLSGHTQGVLHG